MSEVTHVYVLYPEDYLEGCGQPEAAYTDEAEANAEAERRNASNTDAYPDWRIEKVPLLRLKP